MEIQRIKEKNMGLHTFKDSTILTSVALFTSTTFTTFDNIV